MNVLLKSSGLFIAFLAVFLQIAVFLQPLLPVQYQIAPVCETVSALVLRSHHAATLQTLSEHHSRFELQQSTQSHLDNQHQHHQHDARHNTLNSVVDNILLFDAYAQQTQASDADIVDIHHHDPNHQCQYCNVYGNLVLPTKFGVDPILIKIQVRLLAFIQSNIHVYFKLQQLYLMPQGRAPPNLFAIQ